MGGTTSEVWGTFSVRDHCRPGAFLREVLLFDTLLVPYPDPAVPTERDRWRHPDPRRPAEDWMPDRLDALLAVLGDEEDAGHNGAHVVQRSMWSEPTWQMIRSKLEEADLASGDPFQDTRLGLRRAREVPGVVEAVAAYPTETAWRTDAEPSEETPDDVSAAEALVMLPRPLLLPDPEIDELEALRAVVELSQDDDFVRARHAYFDWLRDFVEPLRTSREEDLHDLRLDEASLRLAETRLRELWAHEREVVARHDRARRFDRAEVACMTVGAGGAAWLAAAAAMPAVGVPVALLGFGGWALRRATAKRDAPVLSGASMFVDAPRKLDWLDPRAG